MVLRLLPFMTIAKFPHKDTHIWDPVREHQESSRRIKHISLYHCSMYVVSTVVEYMENKSRMCFARFIKQQNE